MENCNLTQECLHQQGKTVSAVARHSCVKYQPRSILCGLQQRLDVSAAGVSKVHVMGAEASQRVVFNSKDSVSRFSCPLCICMLQQRQSVCAARSHLVSDLSSVLSLCGLQQKQTVCAAGHIPVSHVSCLFCMCRLQQRRTVSAAVDVSYSDLRLPLPVSMLPQQLGTFLFVASAPHCVSAGCIQGT